MSRRCAPRIGGRQPALASWCTARPARLLPSLCPEPECAAPQLWHATTALSALWLSLRSTCQQLAGRERPWQLPLPRPLLPWHSSDTLQYNRHFSTVNGRCCCNGHRNAASLQDGHAQTIPHELPEKHVLQMMARAAVCTVWVGHKHVYPKLVFHGTSAVSGKRRVPWPPSEAGMTSECTPPCTA